MKSRRQMRNIFMRRIDNLLVSCYKEIDFDILFSKTHEGCSDDPWIATAYKKEAMEMIELMKELELLNSGEYILLKQVYGEYFSVFEC